MTNPISFPNRLRVILIPFFFINFTNLEGRAQNLDDLLEMDMSELMKIDVISASKAHQALKDVPASVRLITARQIAQRGYRTLEDVLSDLPGFQFRNIQGFNSYSFLRGIVNQNNLILVLIDGVQVNELNSGGFYGGAQYNLSNVKQIEVVYGPASALYGTNAISGIIHMITNEAEDIKKPEISVLAGNFNTLALDFKYGYCSKHSPLQFTLSGMVNSTEKEDLKQERGDFNWTREMENFEDNISFDSNVVYKNFKAGFLFQDKQASRTTNYKAIGTSNLDHGTLWHIRFLNVYLKHTYQIKPDLNLESLLYFRDSTVMDDTIANIVEGTSGQTGYFRPNHQAGVEAKLSYTPHEKLRVTGGIVIEEERLAESFSITTSGDSERPPPKPASPEMTNNNLISGYIQTQFRFTSRLDGTLGLRHDDSSYYGTVDTPRMALVFNHEAFFSKLMYFKAFRAPKPWDFTYGIGNPQLDPETIRSNEISIGRQFPSNWLADLTYYDNQVADVLTQENRAEGSLWVNAGTLGIKGFEFNVEFKRKSINGYFNYSHNLSINDEAPSYYEISEQTANMGLNIIQNKHLTYNFRLNYIGERANPKRIETTGDNLIQAAIPAHVTVTYSPSDRLSFQIISQNVFDEIYYHPSNRPPDRYRQAGRSVMVKSRYLF